MKKVICLLLVCAMLFGAASVWADDPFDLSYVRSHTSDYEIEVNESKNCAFIYSNLSIKDKAFTHPDSSDSYYSYLEWDILVLDYSKSSRYPIFRLWIVTVNESSYKNFTSVSFIFGGKEYTFTNIASSDRFEIKKGDYQQTMLVKFGFDNIDFVIDLLTYLETMVSAGNSNYDVKMILHGDVDYTISLSENNLLDFAKIATALTGCNGASMLGKATDPNPLTIRDA